MMSHPTSSTVDRKTHAPSSTIHIYHPITHTVHAALLNQMMISQIRWSAAAVHIERGRFPHDVVPVNNNCLKPSPFKFSYPPQNPRTFHSSNTSGTDKRKKKKKKLIEPLAYSSSYYYYRKTPEKLRNYMGSQGSEEVGSFVTKPRFLCLHGFRTSGEIMKKQVGKWPESVLQKLDLVYLDGPFPALGKSDVEGIFDPPYYEWFQFNKEFSEYTNFDKCLEYIEDYIIKQGPFDGLVGFSQGAILSAALPGLQAKGVALTKVPKIKFLIIIGGAKFKSPAVADDAYASPIQCPSLHFLGETDFLKPYGLELLEHCVEPTIIHHPKGHTVPRLDEKSLETMVSFIDKIQKALTEKDQQ